LAIQSHDRGFKYTARKCTQQQLITHSIALWRSTAQSSSSYQFHCNAVLKTSLKNLNIKGTESSWQLLVWKRTTNDCATEKSIRSTAKTWKLHSNIKRQKACP